MTSLYEECVKRGIPTKNRYSDLYIPVTEETTALLNEHGCHKSTFVDQIDGTLSYDVAFQYDPYWVAVKGDPIDYSAQGC